jgi:polysaccharide deacetylase family protein (PEP-CTERM system associated)
VSRHVFTIDLEDWYQGLEIDMADWGQFTPRIERGMRPLLDLLSDAGARSTFFVLGWQAERSPALIRELTDRGHEVASHGYSHRFVYRQSLEQFRMELRRSKQVLENITGQPVIGFRAPFFSITEKSLWALDILVEEGFLYDSSIFPVFNYRYGFHGAGRAPGRRRTPSGATIFEVPLSTVRLPGDGVRPGLNLPMSGGGYFRLYPYRLTWAMAKLLERQGKGLVFYVHPWEYDPTHPRVAMPRLIPKMTHYFNLGSMRGRTRRLLADFRFSPIRDTYAAQIAAARSTRA